MSRVSGCFAMTSARPETRFINGNTARLKPFLGFAAVLASISVVGLSLGLTLPLITLVLRHQGYGSALIGLAAAMPAVGILLSSPLMPRVIHWLGGRRALLAALVVNGATILVMSWTVNYGWWLGLRFLMGAAVGVLFTVSETWVNQLADDRSRGRWVGVYITVLSFCFASGPLLIGLTGSLGAAPFLLACAILLAAALPVALVDVAPIGISDSPSAFGVLDFIRLAPALAAAVGMFAAIDGSTMALLPLFGLRSGFPEATAAAMITVLIAGNIAFQIPLGWLADRYDRSRLLVFCGGGIGVGSLLLLAVASWPILVWPVLVLLGMSAGGVYTLAMIIIGQRFHGTELVTANAAFGVLWGSGSLLGPFLAGLLMRLYDPGGLPLTWALLAAGFLLLYRYRLPKRDTKYS